MRLSSRLPDDLSMSPFFAALENCKTKAESFIDMTVSSPIRVGIPADLANAVEASKGEYGSWVPDACGREESRKAVAEYYAARGGDFSPEHIMLTASTSEAYSILFKTFCDPGDCILTPLPGYPLLDTLAALEHLECYPYFLKLLGKRFVIDTDTLISAPDNAKILLLVSPHNPTGHCVNEYEWNEMVSFCEERNMVLVVDEVFGDFAFEDKVKRSWLFERAKTATCPIFWLNGLSKTVGSPQLKLGWMAIHAREEDFLPMRDALEFVADAYLSVSSPAQALGIPLLQSSLAYEKVVQERLTANLHSLRKFFPESADCPRVYGGWYATIRIGGDDEKQTLALLEKANVLVQPGFFFDFDEDGWIVISLLQKPEVFAEGVERIYRFSSIQV